MSFFVVLLIMLLSSFVFMFFYTAAISSVTSLICFILTCILFHRRLSSCVSFQNWETAFTSPISPTTTHHIAKLSFVLGTLLYFDSVSKILLNQFKYEKNVSKGEYARRERTMLYALYSSVRPLAISCPLFNSWTAWRVSKKREKTC